jgi:diguanylate cyclase (GGDEF)-like protein
MPANIDRRRVLLVAREQERDLIQALFANESLRCWELIEADSFERARFIFQLDPCEVVIDTSLYQGGDLAGMAWLTQQTQTPVLLLGDALPSTILDTLEHGAHYWLSCEMAMKSPALLAATLRQVANFGETRRRLFVTTEGLQESRHQVSRLVRLLWEAAPGDGPARWFAQRYMMERLEEEVARTRRHGGPLTVILGEILGLYSSPGTPAPTEQLATWTAAQVSQAKRRSDVAGQYGLHGFMLILPRVSDREAQSCCRRLQNLLEHPPHLAEGPHAPLQVCFGLATFSPAASTVKGLLSRAEERLERAKAEVRGQEHLIREP